MQQDKNDIEEKLRQLDNQQLPDLSRMDEHWESMKLALQPKLSNNGGKNKWFWLIGLLLLIGSITLFINHKDALPQNDPPAKEISQQAVTVDDTTFSDSPIEPIKLGKSTVKNAGKSKPVNSLFFKPAVENNEIDLPVQLNPKDSTLTAVGPDAQKILNELLSSLAKKAQEFIIDNREDTTLFAAEGSSLFIPANSLGGSSSVKILLKEFYKASDIVLNKLNTTSNGEQLVTGGMVHISASVNDKPVNVSPGKSIKWYLPDTSKQMEEMQLFKGEEKKAGDINWVSTGQRFGWPTNLTEVWVFNISNEPFRVITNRRGDIGVFVMSYDCKLSRTELKSVLKEKYGYYKVRIRRSRGGVRDNLFNRRSIRLSEGFQTIGDSAWVRKELADRYNLQGTQTRIRQGGLWSGNILRQSSVQPNGKKSDYISNVDTLAFGNGDTLIYSDRSVDFQNGLNKLQEKYSVNISSLGWINCDRFYNDRREKINYYVDLQDSAVNYFTMIVFNRMRSMMTGYIMGSQVQFSNVPVGESVKIISIGVDKKGETVIAMQETTISKKGLAGLPFEAASANNIKSSLTQADKTP